MMMFLSNKGETPDLELSASTSTGQNATLTVLTARTTPQNIDIPSTGTLNIDPDLIHDGTSLSYKGIFISSPSVDIVLFALNKGSMSCSMYSVFPVKSLGTDYYPISFWPNTGFGKSQFGIVATTDNTEVQITMKRLLDITNLYSLYTGFNYGNSTSMTLYLDAFESVQIQSSEDLSGTHIVSDKPVAVFSGNDYTGVNTDNYGSRGHFSEQVPSVDKYGYTFYVLPLPGRERIVMRFVASESNTMVIINNQRRYFMANPGDVYDVNLAPVNLEIISNKPIMVAQFAKSQGLNGAYNAENPSMLIVPAAESFRSGYMFTIPGDSVPGKRYMLLIVNSTDIVGLRLDSGQLDQYGWLNIGNNGMKSKILEVSAGLHYIVHDKEAAKFGTYVYVSNPGYCSVAYQAFPAGRCLQVINYNTPVTAATAAPPITPKVPDTRTVGPGTILSLLLRP